MEQSGNVDSLVGFEPCKFKPCYILSLYQLGLCTFDLFR